MSQVARDAAPRIMGLRELLMEPAVSATPEAEVVEPGPDPVALLEQERQRVRADAEKKGYAEGMAKAEKAIEAAREQARQDVEAAHAGARETLEAATAGLQGVIEALNERIAELDAASERLAVDVAAAAVARILGQAYVDSEAMVAICRQALEEYRQRPVVIRLSVEDLDMVRSEVAALGDVTIEVDSALKRGQCRLETDRGWYDTSLVTRFEAITRALSNELGDEP